MVLFRIDATTLFMEELIGKLERVNLSISEQAGNEAELARLIAEREEMLQELAVIRARLNDSFSKAAEYIRNAKRERAIQEAAELNSPSAMDTDEQQDDDRGGKRRPKAEIDDE